MLHTLHQWDDGPSERHRGLRRPIPYETLLEGARIFHDARIHLRRKELCSKVPTLDLTCTDERYPQI